jgi:4-amino-4-deoxy-L-arabinose transferase-like glycosyltransferase
MESSPDKFSAVLIALLFVVMLSTAHLWGVVETSEARYAEISREMYRSGDWLHPTLLNIHHYHKPPMTYWLTAASYSVFGVNFFATRALLAVSFALQVWIVFHIAKQLFNNADVAWRSALVYATLPIVLISARGLTTDSYVATFMALGIYCWIKFRTSGSVGFLFGCSAALGLGFLTKGPVALLVPGLVMVGSRYATVEARPGYKMLYTLAAMILFLVVALSWFVVLVAEDLRFAGYFFFHHLVDRVAHAEVFSRQEPWYYYLVVIPIVFLPWITFFIMGSYNKQTKTSEDQQALVRDIAIWWFLLPLVAFSLFSSKLILYILPLSIGFSLVTGYSISQGIRKASLTIFTGMIVLVYIGLISVRFIAPSIAIHPAVQMIPMFSLLGTLAIAFFNIRYQRRIVISASIFALTLVLFSSALFGSNGIEVNTLKPVSSFIIENNLRNRNIVVYNQLLPSLAFELDKQIISIYAGNKYLKRETQFEKDGAWKDSLIDATSQASNQRIDSLLSQNTVLIVREALPVQLKVHVNSSWNKKAFGKWLVYYN